MKLNRKYVALPLLLLGPSAYALTTLVTDAVFAKTSFWYKPIPANAPVHWNSPNLVKEFLRQKTTYYNTVTINTRDYASPVYTAPAGARTMRVKQWDCQKKGYLDPNLAKQWAAVPIPSYAVPSKGTDAEMTVYQPSTRILWEFWQTRKISGQWQACWGGRMVNTHLSGGVFPGYYGTTATSLPFIGGQITADELRRGEIRHVMGISLVELEHYNIVSWPAHRSDGWNPRRIPNRIPEGLRFRLDPRVNVDALQLSRVGKIVAKAAQKYGFVVWDRAGAVSLRAQNAVSYTVLGHSDPYPTLFQGKPGYAVLNGFPWSRIQFLPMHYGRP